MANRTVGADSARDNILTFKPRPRPLRADVPAFDSANPAHLRAWKLCGILDSGRCVMGALERIGPPALPAAVMRILDRFNRDELGNAIKVLVALLDIWDGDAEAEVTDAEDDSAEYGQQPWYGPGCEFSDAPECDDEPEHDDPDTEHDGREEELGVY